jgi:hypothetical protein
MGGSAAGGTVGSGGTAAGGTGGTGGTDTGGSTGGTPMGGTGGSGSSVPSCTTTDWSVVADVDLFGADGTLVATSVTAAVTVASVDSCAVVACPSGTYPTATRIALTAGTQSWTLYLTSAALPSDLVKAGDAFDMTVVARTDTNYATSISQTVVLAHGTDLVLFGADLSTTVFPLPAVLYAQQPPLPDSSAFGITFADLGTGCALSCSKRAHGVRVTVGTETATIVGRGTARVGWLSFSSGQFDEGVNTGMCDNPQSDGKPKTLMVGFRVP